MTIPERTTCFSGYRPEKFVPCLERGDHFFDALGDNLRQAVIKAVADGYTDFLCGMARGFDLLAGSVVLGLKDKKPELANIRLVAVLPFEGHGCAAHWGAIHRTILERADEVITLAPQYRPQVYHDRNRYMVDHSSRLICFYDGQPGGTAYTVRYAERRGLEICNLASATKKGD